MEPIYGTSPSTDYDISYKLKYWSMNFCYIRLCKLMMLNMNCVSHQCSAMLLTNLRASNVDTCTCVKKFTVFAESLTVALYVIRAFLPLRPPPSFKNLGLRSKQSINAAK